VKRSTAIGHLVGIAEEASDGLRLRAGDIGWPLEELWVTGELLGLADTVEQGAVVLVLDVPAEDLPWLAVHPDGEWIGSRLGLGKRPIGWCYRPLTWPAWNHEHRRVARFWTATDGLDAEVIEALRSRRLDRLTVAEPSDAELAEQLRTELPVSRRHLRTLLDTYWDRRNRPRSTGYEAPRRTGSGGRPRRSKTCSAPSTSSAGAERFPRVRPTPPACRNVVGRLLPSPGSAAGPPPALNQPEDAHETAFAGARRASGVAASGAYGAQPASRLEP
jgi:hypothetical protein